MYKCCIVMIQIGVVRYQNNENSTIYWHGKMFSWERRVEVGLTYHEMVQRNVKVTAGLLIKEARAVRLLQVIFSIFLMLFHLRESNECNIFIFESKMILEAL